MSRKAKIERRTKETQITAEIDLDGTGAYDISTGIGFLYDTLEQLARHGLIDIKLKAKGDLHIDFHHSGDLPASFWVKRWPRRSAIRSE